MGTTIPSNWKVMFSVCSIFRLFIFFKRSLFTIKGSQICKNPMKSPGLSTFSVPIQLQQNMKPAFFKFDPLIRCAQDRGFNSSSPKGRGEAESTVYREGASQRERLKIDANSLKTTSKICRKNKSD